MKKETKQSGLVSEIISWIGVIVVAVALAWFLTSFIIINATVPSGSMENTIQKGDRLFGSRLNYLFSDPKRGDIVVFRYPVNKAVRAAAKEAGVKVSKSESAKTNYIKRIIGLPGETVEISKATVTITQADGTSFVLEEPYLKEEWIVANDGITFEVPEDCYLMMGDNRNNSSDSRYWAQRAWDVFSEYDLPITVEEALALSFVKRSQILGKAYVRYWPITTISSLYRNAS